MGLTRCVLIMGTGLVIGSLAAQAAGPEYLSPNSAQPGPVLGGPPAGFATIAPPTPGFQQPQGPWTLAELEQLALGSNPTLAQAAARVEAARGQWIQVGLYPNPTAGYIGSEIGNEGRAGQQGGFVNQELVTAGKLGLNRAVASEEIRQADLAWQAQRLRVLTDVRRNFYDVLVAQQATELAGQLAQIGQKGVQSTETLLKAKEVARNDVLQARIEADTASVLLERARNRYLAAWRNLMAVTGTCDTPPRPLSGSVQDGMVEIVWEAALNKLWCESPEVARAQAGVGRAQAQLNRECAGRIPNVELQGAVQYDNATRDMFTSIQVGVPVPVHNRNQGNIHRAQAELTAAQNEIKRVQLELQQRLAVAFEQYTNARYQVEKYSRDILPNAKASLDLTTSGYQHGEFSYLALLTAQRTYFQTNLTYLEALRDLRTAAATIEGNLLSSSLQVADSPDRGTQQR